MQGLCPGQTGQSQSSNALGQNARPVAVARNRQHPFGQGDRPQLPLFAVAQGARLPVKCQALLRADLQKRMMFNLGKRDRGRRDNAGGLGLADDIRNNKPRLSRQSRGVGQLGRPTIGEQKLAFDRSRLGYTIRKGKGQ